MKRSLYIFLVIIAISFVPIIAEAQGCSVCTRTTAQMGDEPAGKLNAGILYLAATPLAIAGFIGYRWWRKNND